MAELNEDDIRRLAPPFLEAFNARSGTRYRMEDFRRSTDPSADLYFLSSEFGNLKVQWTTPPIDESERLSVVRLHRFSDDVIAALTQAGLRGFALGLQIKAVPRNRRERLEVLAALIGLVHGVRDAHSGGFSDTAIPSWHLPRYPGGLSAYFAEVNVVAHPNPSALPVLLSGPAIGSHVPSTTARVESAIERKANHYRANGRDLVLVVEFNMDFYCEYELEAIQRSLKARPDEFEQVWILCDPAIGLPKAHWVKGEKRSRAAAT